MNPEKFAPKTEPIPQEHELPLRVKSSEAPYELGKESEVWRVLVETPGGQERLIALKQARREEFSTDEAMRRNKEFYDFLKSVPEFGRFVQDTLYFKARRTASEQPRAYRLQKEVSGARIDKLSDNALYKDPVVIRQLLEFTDAALAVFEIAKAAGKKRPDFYGSRFEANFLNNPRYTSNIIITEKPDENGRRVFFVDTGLNIDAEEKVLNRFFDKHVGSKLQPFQLRRWRELLENRLKTASKEKSL